MKRRAAHWGDEQDDDTPVADEFNVAPEGAAYVDEGAPVAGDADMPPTDAPDDTSDAPAASDEPLASAESGMPPPDGTVVLVMSGQAPRRISPPITAGDYVFYPGEATEVLAVDAPILIGHEALAARGVTFAEADLGTAAAPPRVRKLGRGCCGQRG